MKKIFLVKKNPDMSSSDNWITMNGHEFAMFMKTPEGKARKENFGVIAPVDKEDAFIYIETTKEEANEMNAKYQNSCYLKRCEKESGIATVSLYSLVDEESGTTLADIIPDESQNMEKYIEEKLLITEMYKAINKLTDIEKAVVKAFWLSDRKITEREFGSIYKKSRNEVEYLKRNTLKKIRRLMNVVG